MTEIHREGARAIHVRLDNTLISGWLRVQRLGRAGGPPAVPSARMLTSMPKPARISRAKNGADHNSLDRTKCSHPVR